jgi:flagellar protein FlaI
VRELQITGYFKRAMANNPHLRLYIRNYYSRHGVMPEYVPVLRDEMSKIKSPDLIYPIGDPLFIHIHTVDKDVMYKIIEPCLSPEGEKKYDKTVEALLFLAQRMKEPGDTEELIRLLDDLLLKISAGNKERGIVSRFSIVERIRMSDEELLAIRYKLYKNIVGVGILEPFIRDPYLEDIFASGLGPVFVMHKIFRMLKTDLILKSDAEMDEFCQMLSEVMGRPLSDATPIADGTLPDGSRANIVYSRAISKRGSSFSVRKLPAEPLSITRIIQRGTLDEVMAAYLWLSIEHGMNIFICGESACGKTTLLNACCAFIQPMAKVYSCEDTAEVTVPHKCWQQLTTRTTGSGKNEDIGMQDLLITSLRSRPNYILVGEIRGTEGSIAFQAMQTGHPVMATFHASSVRKMVQRLTGNPIKIPVAYIENLNIAVIMGSFMRGKHQLRRVMELAEIEGYSPAAGGVVLRSIFNWDSVKDYHEFKGLYNSFILEDRIGTILGYEDKRKIYQDLAFRAAILREMVKRGIFDYYEVFQVTKNFFNHGPEGLPFKVEERKWNFGM